MDLTADLPGTYRAAPPGSPPGSGGGSGPDENVVARWPLRLCASELVSVQQVHDLCICAHHGPVKGVEEGEGGAEMVVAAVVGDGVQMLPLSLGRT